MSKKSILQYILIVLARAMIRRYQPIVIGVTGSVGKTSTREAIAAVLRKKYTVRTPEKNFNNEIGLPLTILGVAHCGRNFFKWAVVLAGAALRVYLITTKYPDILVLEYGVDHPGDMDILLGIAQPSIGVITAIGEIPVHMEFFKNAEELAREKQKLIEGIGEGGYAILNADDARVYDMAGKTYAKIITCGFSEKADVRAGNYEIRLIKHNQGMNVPEGLTFKIEYAGSVVPIRLRGALGKPQTYAASAAVAVGAALGINLIEASEALRGYIPQAGRMRLVAGINHSLILDDTYNAAPESVRAALDTLRSIPAQRKIAVLGTMAELGGLSEQAHLAVGVAASKCADIIIGVGDGGTMITQSAHKQGFPHKKIFHYENSFSAGGVMLSLIKEGDLILVKGSQSMRMERIIEKIMAEPKMAKKLLVRQDDYWKKDI